MDHNAFISSGFLNIPFFEEMYTAYKNNPDSIDISWRTFFTNFESNKESTKHTIFEAPDHPILQPDQLGEKSVIYYPKIEIKSNNDDLRIYNLINAYRTYGHLTAKINPLDPNPAHREIPQLNLEHLGFTKQDLPIHFPTFGLFDEEQAPLLDIINALKSTYCEKIGVEYMGFVNPDLEEWLQQHIEPKRFRINLPIEQKQLILQHLNKSELFESFIHTRYVGQKRFSLEGAETLIPILADIIDLGASMGVLEYVLGMAHRGRLNVLSNILDKSYAEIFSEFEEGYIPASVEGSGDVKYHKGFYSEVKTIHGVKVKITLTPNPSHLESVGPVVEGQVRAKQDILNFENGQNKIIPILIHGDAALSGQGVVYETLQFCRLNGYKTGGTVHIVINNQIGFTTIPDDSRSTTYCTDIAHAFGAPIFHVNAEDPEGCIYATNLAIQMRQKFHCDVFIDLNCYRKYGHNETDEPAFTQPIEYQQIRKKRPIRDLYRDDLINQGFLEKSVAETLETEFKQSLSEAQKQSKIPSKKHSIPAIENTLPSQDVDLFKHIQTGVQKSTLQQIGERICTVPPGLTLHPKLVSLNKDRLAMIKDGPDARPLDWGMGELLAYGSILWEGRRIRISGQDSCRGTFSHRHALLMDQVKEQGYIPLKHLKSNQGVFDIYNSSLSEFAVLGFEFGYSIGNPDTLVIWEAQFGDFANGAQIVIDQFISTAEQKWNQKFNLTLLLPHGYEGQGPEHSSARIERFLTLAGDNNMQITQPTSPAQFFHLLRRQTLGPLKKPLIVFTPKGLLRHPACISHLDDLTKGSFQEILDDPSPPTNPSKLVFCSGRIFFDLIAERDKSPGSKIAIIRIEQLYPLDTTRLKTFIEKYSGFTSCCWVQDEPSNMGPWDFLRPILRDLLPKNIEPTYIGRNRSASPATGSHAAHKKEHATIINALFNKNDPTIFEIASKKS